MSVVGGFGVGSGRWWRERVPAVVALVVVAVLIAGTMWLVLWLNRDDHKPARGPVSVASASPRATEQPPVLPDAAKQQNLDGVKAAALFETAALNYAQRSGDLGPLKLIYDIDNCPECKGVVEETGKLVTNGRKLLDGDYEAKPVGEPVTVAGQSDLIYLNVSVKQLKDPVLVDKDSHVLQHYSAAKEDTYTYRFKFSGGNWIISGFSKAGNLDG